MFDMHDDIVMHVETSFYHNTRLQSRIYLVLSGKNKTQVEILISTPIQVDSTIINFILNIFLQFWSIINTKQFLNVSKIRK